MPLYIQTLRPVLNLRPLADAVQTARSLLKGLVAVKGGKQARGNGAYLNEVGSEAGRRCHVRSPQDWLQPEAQIGALRCAPPPLQSCFPSPV